MNANTFAHVTIVPFCIRDFYEDLFAFHRYGPSLGPGISAETLVKEFLGAGEGAEKINSTTGSFSVRGALDIDTSSSSMETNGVAEEASGSNQQAEFIERVKYIPLRLTWSERKSLRLCEAALNVSFKCVPSSPSFGFCLDCFWVHNHYSYEELTTHSPYQS